MDERSALLRAIIANPDDDTPRLVFADWLDENGEPGEAGHAELIRLQVGKCSEAVFRKAERRWKRDGHTLWAMRGAFLLNDSFRWEFARPWRPEQKLGKPPLAVVERGFVSGIVMPISAFLTDAGNIFCAHPVAAVSLSDRNPSTYWENDGFRAAWQQEGAAPLEPWTEIPDDLFDLLRSDKPTDPRGWYAEADRARKALSRACLTYGRRERDRLWQRGAGRLNQQPTHGE